MIASEGIDMFEAEYGSLNERQAKDLVEIAKCTCTNLRLQDVNVTGFLLIK